MKGNIISIYILTLFRVLIPLVIIPIFSRTLGVEEFGKYYFYQAISFVISIFFEFGFNITYTRIIAKREHEQRRLVSEVVSFQLCSLLLILLLSLLVSQFVSVSTYDILLFVLWGASVGAVPTYFFQGNNKIWVVSLYEIVINSVFLISVFLLIWIDVDVDVDAALLIEGQVLLRLMGLCALYRIVYTEVRGFFIKFTFAKQACLTAASSFLYRLSVNAYTTINVIIVGKIFGPSAVALYSPVEKLVKASLNFITPISQVVYPIISKGGKLSLVTSTALVQLSLAVSAMLTITWLSDPLIAFLLGEDFSDATELLHVFVFVIPIITISNILAFQVLFPKGLESKMKWSVFLGAIVNLLLILILHDKLTVNNYVYIVLASEAAVVIGMVIIYFLGKK
ncbi:oligosaccharide flippase family protein [Vibrio sp. F13]|uniref:oligosaccharide flippase family protein n=1 Tax=Vibrio sp. F13 TaxID=2070777 RepID=UPI0014821350|nr:oligosaccharide flippase family protein [Vibrio sp. F13]